MRDFKSFDVTEVVSAGLIGTFGGCGRRVPAGVQPLTVACRYGRQQGNGRRQFVQCTAGAVHYLESFLIFTGKPLTVIGSLGVDARLLAFAEQHADGMPRLAISKRNGNEH